MTTAQPFDLTGPLPTGTCVLEASAGTGKTYAITALAVRYLADGIFGLDQIMMVTFSRAATSELRSRVHDRLRSSVQLIEAHLVGQPMPADPVDQLLLQGDVDQVRQRLERLRTAMAEVDRATIATTHEFCHRMLVGLGILGDHDDASAFVEDVTELATQACQDVWLAGELARGSERAPAKMATWQKFLEVGLAATIHEPTAPLIPADAPALTASRVEFATRVRAEFEARKRRLGVYTFDDMVQRLRSALTDPISGQAAVEALSSRYRLVLIDEFQDTDPVQWEIVREAFVGRSTVVLIGDPKQAIYGFRGAEVNAYLDAIREADSRWTLLTNYRSDRAVVDAVHEIFAERAMGSAEIIAHEVAAHQQQPRLVAPDPGPAVEIRCVPGERPTSSWTASQAIDVDVVDQVTDLLSGDWQLLEADPASGQVEPRRLSPHDIAILVRGNRHGERLRQALVDANVAAVFSGSDPVFASPAAHDWLVTLRALVEPQHSSMKKACLTSLFGWTEAELAAAVREDPGLAPTRRLAGLAVQVTTLSRLLERQGIAAVHEYLNDQTALQPRLLSQAGGERLLTDLRHVAQLMNAEQGAHRLSPAALLGWLSDRVAEASGTKADDRTRRLETDRSCVQVMTVHAAKGLEFPVVLLPDAANHWLPKDELHPQYMHIDGKRVLDVGVDGAREGRWLGHQADEQAEELRILYVAMTRAKSRLVLWWAPTGQNTAGSPLHRLLAGPRVARGQLDADYPLFPSPHEHSPLEPSLVRVSQIGQRHRQAIEAPAVVEAELHHRVFTRSIDNTWRRTSYSGLTAEAHGLATTAIDVDVDVDESEPAELVPVAPLPAELGQANPGAAVKATSPLTTMPGGVQFGTLVHAVLEQTDTAASDLRAELDRRVGPLLAHLPVAGVEATALSAGLEMVLRTPLGPLGEGLTLADITPRDRLAELDFELPMGGASAWSTLDDLAAALQDESITGGDAFAERYGRHLASSPIATKTLHGFLTGSIDAVLRLPSGRHLVVDYKTNRLPCEGELTVRHYTPQAMAQAMVEAHYPLQALLYSVALHRYLAWRLPAYAPADHLGGVGYLFVRGMAGETTPVLQGTPCGVFSWQPSATLVQRCSALIGGAR